MASQQDIEIKNNIDFTLKASKFYSQEAFSLNVEQKGHLSGNYFQ